MRILDANLNRLREGIRVVEDILRYGFSHKDFALSLKNLRHQCRIANSLELLNTRDSLKDVLKTSTKNEQQRENLKAIFIANFKRAQESARVLEEILKLDNTQESERFKNIRYTLYALEKDILTTIFTS
ncbi:thiamine-phosphate pyrophosphorylase [Helicobacter sp. Faydin-H64]|uniref:Thiamine-phosphate pyrophosphorylase n=1 Tax=Helicobacter turcicus TaxID=2867412 RepID=A0ABS7JMT9_9HELI|nr:thiamine-phosphate pyrophosphorylase [Helicobacter turcicus]MBX7490701.1 thiamine-phosphate pyrophosphorylase [Helicobacter turcicus]MBX7545690.1 thiamine-phosphate pyrophosphorylase [Helicobacter turcicus]